MSKKEIDELVSKFDVVYIRGARPTELITPDHVDLPDDLLIFNAPRPLSGSRIPKDRIFQTYTNFYEWMGDFHHGTLYAGVDPDDPAAPQWLNENLQSDGWLVQYTTIDDARKWLKHLFGSDALRKAVDDADDNYVWQSFLNHHRGQN